MGPDKHWANLQKTVKAHHLSRYMISYHERTEIESEIQGIIGPSFMQGYGIGNNGQILLAR